MSRTSRPHAAGSSAGQAGPVDVGATLERLETSLREATKFLVPWGQFHDEVAMAPAFASLGEPGRNPRIEAALGAVVAKVLGRQYPLTDGVFIHLEEHGFWHGTCRAGPRELIFFYFEGSDTGLVGLFRNLAEGQQELARFSVMELPAGLGLSRDRGQS